ncbi:MAG: MASE1 domain-containing protein [Roseobacter sp.]
MLHHLYNSFVTLLVIALAFVACYGLVAKLVTPIQSIFLTEITTYASLVFLPHGVRILSTMYFGWKAIVPLIIGNWASSYLFGPGEIPYLPDLWALASLVVSGTCAIISFEVFRWFGKNCYFSPKNQTTSWKDMIYVGLLASVLNSCGQVFIYSDHISPAAFMRVASTYALGDTIGLLVTMLFLMLFFRWARIARHAFGK